MCYLRTINNMGTDMNYGRVRDYIDVLPTGKDTTGLYVTEDMLDHLAQTKLNTIRDVSGCTWYITKAVLANESSQ